MANERPLAVKVERQIKALPEAVFDAYVSPEVGRRLFAGDPSWDVVVATDLRVGGVWQIRTGPQGSEPSVETNVFQEIDRPSYLRFMSTFTMPDGYSFDREVEVSFEATPDGGTLMTMEHKGLPSEELRDAFAKALPSVVEELARAVEQ
jgi:uncharacterized protein YndB with AHSA1/START domain